MVDFTEFAKKALEAIKKIDVLESCRWVPSVEGLAAVIEVVFWASLDHYEGQALKPRVHFAPESVLGNDGVVRLDPPLPLHAQHLRRMARAQATDGGILVVDTSPDRVSIRALLASTPSVNSSRPWWVCVEAKSAGVVSVRLAHHIAAEFVRGKATFYSGPAMDSFAGSFWISLICGVHGQHAINHSSLFMQLAMAIDRLGCGGSLWILPAGKGLEGPLEGLGQPVSLGQQWLEPFRQEWEMQTPILKLLNTPGWIAESMLGWAQQAGQQWQALQKEAAMRTIASLAQLDGAIVMNGDPKLLAFGVVCNNFPNAPDEVFKPEHPGRPRQNHIGSPVTEFGGSRHRSAINFCASCAPAGALVASHDGGITAFVGLEKGKVIGARISTIAWEPKTVTSEYKNVGFKVSLGFVNVDESSGASRPESEPTDDKATS